MTDQDTETAVQDLQAPPWWAVVPRPLVRRPGLPGRTLPGPRFIGAPWRLGCCQGWARELMADGATREIAVHATGCGALQGATRPAWAIPRAEVSGLWRGERERVERVREVPARAEAFTSMDDLVREIRAARGDAGEWKDWET